MPRVISSALLGRLCRARSRLEHELEPPVGVAQVAADAGLSTSHFIAQFAAVFGETPAQCRNRARLERGRQLLAEGSLSATQIGLALGFGQPGSFSRLFRRRFGVTPRAYRKTVPSPGPPAGCVALMNLAMAMDRDFGEVRAAGGS